VQPQFIFTLLIRNGTLTKKFVWIGCRDCGLSARFGDRHCASTLETNDVESEELQLELQSFLWHQDPHPDVGLQLAFLCPLRHYARNTEEEFFVHIQNA